MFECKEAGGRSEQLEIPYCDLSEIQELIEALDYDTDDIDNVWFGPFDYQPEDKGVGCHYKIIPVEGGVLLDIYCGC